jgi:SP family sugar:H+ symporter-like MFS transporter
VPKRSQAAAIGVAVAAAVGGFLFGFDTSVINGAVDAITHDFALQSAVTGVVVAVALIGSAVGAWFAGRIADRFGRVPVMVVGSILFLVSSIGSAFAFAAWDLGVWRFVGGLGIGVASVIAPTYIAETAPARIRGRLTALQQMAIVIGIFVALLSDAALNNAAGGAEQPWLFGLNAWRWMFLIGVIPSVVYGMLAFSIPESPRFLIARGKVDEARAVLRRVLSETGDELDARVASIQTSLQRETKPSIRDILAPKTLFVPVVWAALGFCSLQQFVGINVIFYYSTSLWQAVGFDASFSFTASVISAAVNLVSTLIGIALIDSVGRRPLLLAGSAGMAVSLAFMAIGFSQAVVTTVAGVPTPHLEGGWGVATLIAANAFVVMFATTWGATAWTVVAEMFPNRLRGTGVAVAVAANWLSNFLVTVTFPVLRDTSLGFTYGLYALFAVVSFVFVFFRIKETKGIELEDMTESFTVVRRRRSGQV